MKTFADLKFLQRNLRRFKIVMESEGEGDPVTVPDPVQEGSAGGEESLERPESRERDRPSSSASDSVPADQNPWPYIDSYFEFLHVNDTGNVQYKCRLCKLKKVVVKGHKSTLNNYRLHISKHHHNQQLEFEEVLWQHSGRENEKGIYRNLALQTLSF